MSRIATPVEIHRLLTLKDGNLALSYNVSQHFSWREVFGKVPEAEHKKITLAMLENALKLSKALEELRAKYKASSVVVNSWLRPPTHNKRVGGATQSVHMSGLAADVLFAGRNNNEIYNELNAKWRGGIAIKRDWSRAVVFIHIDLGEPRRWEYK